MISRRKYQPFTSQDFERVLRGFEGREVPATFYKQEWVNKHGVWSVAWRAEEVWEICYVVHLRKKSERWLLIYSTIGRETGKSRAVGIDTIRTVLVDDNLKPLEKRQRRINRTGNWREKVLERIWEYIHDRN